ncbi:MAG: FHA domain-containing protein [Planctomycetota bacterium]
MIENEDAPGTVLLVGTEGLVEGEIFRINQGETIVVGRSRSCDISLRKCFKYLALDPEERKKDRHFQTVSRKHLRLIFKDKDQIELENMGANGTFIDGTKVDKVIITDVRFQTHEVLLGTREKFRLEWRGEEDLEPVPDQSAGTLEEGAPGASDGAADHASEGPTRRVEGKEQREPGETWQTAEEPPE